MTPAESARAEILAKTGASDITPETERALRYAADIAIKFDDYGKALRHMHQHAGYTSVEDKRKAFLDAAEIFTEHTGEVLPAPIPVPVTRLDIAYGAIEQPGLLPGFGMAACL